MHKSLSRGLLAFVLVGAAACSSDTRDSISSDVESAVTEVGEVIDDASQNAVEALVRNIATQQGEEQFKNAGQELDGPLTCEATVDDGLSKVVVDCTGTTADGGAATLTGSTSELPGASVVELEGEFTGSVDGTEVFSTQRLGG